MKRFLAILTVLCLILSCETAAFAQIRGKDANGISISESPVNGDAQYVSANEPEDDLTVNGNVTGDSTGDSTGYSLSVFASDGAAVTVNGNVTEEKGNEAVMSYEATVIVTGNVTESGESDAVIAYQSTVTVGGNISESDDGNAIYASGAGTTVTVAGNVTEYAVDNIDHAIVAGSGATVTVGGDVTENGGVDAAVEAFGEGTKIEVTGNVIQNGDGIAVYAEGGAEVTVGGNVIETGEGNAVKANGADISVSGNVTAGDSAVAVMAENGSTVTVAGDAVTGDAVIFGDSTIIGVAVNAADSKVTVGGNAVAGKDSVAVYSVDKAAVIIEGKAIGEIAQKSSGEIYLGQLTGNITESSDKDHIHYLINTDTGSATLDQFSVSGDISVLSPDTVDGVNRTGYHYTTTADTAVLGGKSLILKPTDSSKKLSISGLDAGADVTLIANGDGSVTLTLGNNFAGGLQSLMLLLENIAQDNPGVAADIIARFDNVIPAIYVDDSYTVATATVELPEGAEEGAVVPLDIPNHAGIKIAASLLSKTAENHFVQLFLNGEPVPEDAYTVTANRDGSVSVLLSNTWLLALGNGTHSFSVLADGTEIRFSALVAK